MCAAHRDGCKAQSTATAGSYPEPPQRHGLPQAAEAQGAMFLAGEPYGFPASGTGPTGSGGSTPRIAMQNGCTHAARAA